MSIFKTDSHESSFVFRLQISGLAVQMQIFKLCTIHMCKTFVWKHAHSIQHPLPPPQQNQKLQPQPITIGLKPQQLPTQPQHI